MLCPVCKSSHHEVVLASHENGFDENLARCQTCKALWSVNHGRVEIVDEPGGDSFLQAMPEAVEADDYNSAG